MRFYLFPFEEIEKGSKILIYGGGIIGKQFLNQITLSNYCKCLCVVDRNYKEISCDFNVDVVAPEMIAKYDFDKVIVASTLYFDEIYLSLIALNIPKRKIVHKKITSIQESVADKGVHIYDYDYNPKRRDSLAKSKIGELLDQWWASRQDETLDLIKSFISYKESYEKIPFDQRCDGQPAWNNTYIPPFDLISLYGFLAKTNPRYYVEVGSGNTTLFAARSIRDNHLRTKIISIDPKPRAIIDSLCEKVYRLPLEDLNPAFFEFLSDEDIFLIDGSHRSFPNSDVTVFFTEILPKLPSGILYTLHDIYLPYDYPRAWSCDEKRWYDEQYLLCAYILGGADGDKIILPNAYLSHKANVRTACGALWDKGQCFEGMQFGGDLFWMEKS
jgi:hypothetical protein